MKKVIRLTESDLHRIVKESVERILEEDDTFRNHVSQRIIDDLKASKSTHRAGDSEWIKKRYACNDDVANDVANKLK